MQRRILSGLLLAGMLLSLFFACGEKNGNAEKEKIPVLFSIPEGDEERLAVTVRAVYTGEEELGEVFFRGDELCVVRSGMSAVLNESYQPGEWRREEYDEPPRAVFDRLELYPDRLRIEDREFPLEPGFGETYIGFWSFAGTEYLVADRVVQDAVENEETIDRYTVLYPLSEEGPGDPERVEGITASGMATGTDGKWNYFSHAGFLCRTDGKVLQNLGNLVSFGVKASVLRSIEPLAEDRVLLLSGANLILLSVGEAEAEEKKEEEGRGTVVIGTDVNTSSFFSDLLARYNMTSGDKVELREYITIEKLNLAILSGEVDMAASLSADVLKNYAMRGILAPLDEVIGGTLSAGEISPNVLDAGKINGKVYMIPDAVRVSGMMLPKTVVEEKGGGFADMQDLIDTLDGLSSQRFYRCRTRENALTGILINGGMTFWIDMDTGTCRFTDESFISMLEFCNRFAQNDSEVFASGGGERPLLNPYYVMETLTGYEFGLAYESPKGSGKTNSPYGIAGKIFPCPTGKDAGFALLPDMLFGVVENSAVKRSAGDFLTWILSEECQDLKDEMIRNFAGMPVRVSSLRKQAEKDEDAKTGYEIFQKADHYGSVGGTELNQVIEEEAKRYFSGEITAEKAAEYIQNRVSIYLAEQG